jgi:enoyl-CoA hydratase
VLHSEVRDNVALVTIDRPSRRNALDHATLGELATTLDSTASEVRALIVTGAGGHFCAGADLTGVEDGAFTDLLNRVLVRLGEMHCVTIAAAEGAALGAGTQLAVACDLRVAGPTTSFGIPAGKLGLAVDTWTVDRLTMLAGHGPARAMLLASEVFTGEEAHRLGMVQRLGGLDDALAWAKSIAALAPLTVQAHKAALSAADGRGGDGALEAAEIARKRAWTSEDLQEGLAAFKERRAPRFQGR